MIYKNLLVAISCGDTDEKVLQHAAALANSLDASLTAIHVNDPAAGKTHSMMDSLPKFDDAKIREHFDQLGFDTYAKSMQIISAEGEHYPSVIAEAAADYDLLIIGHRRKGKMLAFMTDSTDEKVADLAQNCIMLVPLD